MELIRRQLPARGMNQLLSQVGSVAAYGCVALAVVTTGRLGHYSVDDDALFNIVGTWQLARSGRAQRFGDLVTCGGAQA